MNVTTTTTTTTTTTINTGNDRSADRPLQPFPTLIVQRDDGLFQIGLDLDAPGPFPTRRFAETVAGRAMIDD